MQTPREMDLSELESVVGGYDDGGEKTPGDEKSYRVYNPITGQYETVYTSTKSYCSAMCFGY